MSDAPQQLGFDATGFAIRPLFATPIAVATLMDPGALNAQLTALILARAAVSPGVVRSNAGGWQSTDDFVTWAGAAGAALLDAMRRLADQLTAVQTQAGLSRTPPRWRVNAWANVNRRGDVNHPHHHPGAFWSGVYWVDAGGADAGCGGELEVQDPRGVLPGFYAPTLRYAVPGCLSAGLSDFIEPRTGAMVMFPAWLVHGVRPFRGERPRISVAFNFSV